MVVDGADGKEIMGLGGRGSVVVWAWRWKLETLLSDLRFVLRRREEGHSVECSRESAARNERDISLSGLCLPRISPGVLLATPPDTIQIYYKHTQTTFSISASPFYPAFPNSLSHAATQSSFFCFSLPLPVTLPPPFLPPTHTHTYNFITHHFPPPLPPLSLSLNPTLSLCVPPPIVISNYRVSDTPLSIIPESIPPPPSFRQQQHKHTHIQYISNLI